MAPCLAPFTARRRRLASGVRSVDIVYAHACAILESGEVRCWGSVIGDGTDKMSVIPVCVRGM